MTNSLLLALIITQVNCASVIYILYIYIIFFSPLPRISLFLLHPLTHIFSTGIFNKLYSSDLKADRFTKPFTYCNYTFAPQLSS